MVKMQQQQKIKKMHEWQKKESDLVPGQGRTGILDL